MAAGEAFGVQKFAEPGRRLFPRHFIELRQDENALGEHTFRQISLAFPALHLGHELRGALELLLVIGQQKAQDDVRINNVDRHRPPPRRLRLRAPPRWSHSPSHSRGGCRPRRAQARCGRRLVADEAHQVRAEAVAHGLR